MDRGERRRGSLFKTEEVGQRGGGQESQLLVFDEYEYLITGASWSSYVKFTFRREPGQQTRVILTNGNLLLPVILFDRNNRDNI